MERHKLTGIQRRLAQRIKALALKRRILLSHLPDRAGVSQTHFWYVLKGVKSPTLAWLEKIAAALGIDAGDLLSREMPSELRPKKR